MDRGATELARFRVAAERAGYPSGLRLVRYLDLVFADVELADRTVLDVGAGAGAASFFALVRGAVSATCLDPLADGSNEAMERQFSVFSESLGMEPTMVRQTFQDFDIADRYDIVLLHNSINHLDEEACRRVDEDGAARAVFEGLANRLHQLVAPGGALVVTDCGRRNLLGSLGLPSPFAPGIDWHIHQEPSTWRQVLAAGGFQHPRVRWDAVSRLGPIGQAVLGNRVGAFLTNSHFILTMQA